MSEPRLVAGPEPIPRRAWAVVVLAALGQTMTTFASSALNVGFPVIEEDLDVERTTLAWTISGYAIAAAAFLLVAGRVADRVGAKRVFLTGMAVFTAASAIAAVAPTATVLIVARVVQGLGAAAMVPSSLSLALHEFPATRRSLAIGAWAGVTAIAGASGPPIGGALIELGSWRLIFVVTIPIGLATLVAGARLFRDSGTRDNAGRLDVVSGPLASIAVGLLVAALLQSATWGWDDPRVIAALLAAPALLFVVARRSATHPTPLVDLDLFNDRRFVVASTMTTLYNAAGSGYWLATPLYLQLVWGWGVLASGFGIAPTPLTHALLAGPMGRLADRGAHRRLMMAGSLITATGMAGLALMTDSTSDYWVEIFPFAILIGVGGAMAWPVFTSGALIDINPDQYGEANGVNLTMRQLGGALGVAVVIAVVGNAADVGPSTFHTAWWLAAAGLLMVVVVVAALYPATNQPEPPSSRSTRSGGSLGRAG